MGGGGFGQWGSAETPVKRVLKTHMYGTRVGPRAAVTGSFLEALQTVSAERFRPAAIHRRLSVAECRSSSSGLAVASHLIGAR